MMSLGPVLLVSSELTSLDVPACQILMMKYCVEVDTLISIFT